MLHSKGSSEDEVCLLISVFCKREHLDKGNWHWFWAKRLQYLAVGRGKNFLAQYAFSMALHFIELILSFKRTLILFIWWNMIHIASEKGCSQSRCGVSFQEWLKDSATNNGSSCLATSSLQLSRGFTGEISRRTVEWEGAHIFEKLYAK